MGPGGGVPAAPSRLPVPLLLLLPSLLLLLLLAPCVSLIPTDDSSASSSPPSPPWSPSTAVNASARTASDDLDNSLETPSQSPRAHEDPGGPGTQDSTRGTDVTQNAVENGPSGAAHQHASWKSSVTAAEEAAANNATGTTNSTTTAPAEPQPLLVAYLSNVAGTDNLRRQGLVVSGAMTYAIDLINRNRPIPGHRLEMIYHDTRGEMLQGTRAVVECRDKGAKAFFGPEDSCYVEAAVAASLNLPMISYVLECLVVVVVTILDCARRLFAPDLFLLPPAKISKCAQHECDRNYGKTAYTLPAEDNTFRSTVPQSTPTEIERRRPVIAWF
ncbi:hypothetical protein HPB51_006122 [Rhipicephalus microplus]|uniref:Receptor ligand binding region domain-containing protein n=1 Tax=Rhipicephalus microplus TaxID=6941 RepID=A0A9J6ERY6_RHIMP|nr:hypothetical protein HPB51_006122 [Rhipicephalus microplus]